MCLRDSVFEHGGVIKNIFPQLEERIQVLLLESKIFSQINVFLYETSVMRDADNCQEVVSRFRTLIVYILRKVFPERKNKNVY